MTPPPPPDVLLAHEGFVRGIARRLLYDREEVEDVVQATWLAALERPPRERESLRTWLARVAHNLAIDSHRRRTRLAEVEPRGARPEAETATLETLAEDDARAALIEAVRELREPYRTALVQQFFERLPPREAARRLGVPVETVRTRVKRGLALLRDRLTARRGGDARASVLALLPLAGPPPLGWRIGHTAFGRAFARTAAAALVATVLLVVVEDVRSAAPLEERFAAAALQQAAEGAGGRAGADQAGATGGRASLVRSLAIELVRSGDARAVPGATLRLGWGDGAPAEATSDAEGRARLALPRSATGAAAGGGFEVAIGPTALAHARTFTLAADALPPENAPLRIELPRASSASGIVRDEHGAAVAGAHVRIWFGGPPAAGAGSRAADRELATEPDGRFAAGGLENCFWLAADSGALESSSCFYARVGTARDFEAVDLVLTGPRAFAGRVRDARTGRPVAGAAIACVSGAASVFPSTRGPVDGASYHYARPVSAETDAEGRFDLAGGPAVLPELRVTAPGYVQARVRRFEFDDARRAQGLAIDLEPCPEVVVDVEDELGGALPGASVFLNHSVRGAGTPVTDREGRARLRVEELPEEGNVLRVEAAGRAVVLLEGVAAAALRAGTRVRLEPESPLELELVDALGAPVRAGVEVGFACSAPAGAVASRARLATLRDLHRLAAGTADASGRFVVHAAGRTELLVTLFDEGRPGMDMLHPTRTWRVRAGAGRVRLAPAGAEPAARLTGRIVGAQGALPAGVRVTALELGEPGRRSYGAVSADGRYELELAGNGRWLVDLRAPGCAPAVFEWDAAAGGGARDVRIAPARSLRLVVQDARGAPVAGGLLFLRDRSGASVFARAGTMTAADHVLLSNAGEAVLEGVPATELVLTLHPRGLDRPAVLELDLSGAVGETHLWRVPGDLAAGPVLELGLDGLAGAFGAHPEGAELRAYDPRGAELLHWRLVERQGTPRLAPDERVAVLTAELDGRPHVTWRPPLNDEWLYGAHGQGVAPDGYRLPLGADLASLEIAFGSGPPARLDLRAHAGAGLVAWRPEAR